jgi:ficolin
MFYLILILLFLDVSCKLPKSCFDLYSSGQITDGIYTINPLYDPFQVYCDMRNEGWMIIAKRINTTPRLYFARKWHEYKDGFGDLKNSFWTSMDILNMITMSENYYLRIDFGTIKNPQYFIEFNLFKIHSENENYKIELGSIRKSNINLKIEPMNNVQFSTEDHDNDFIKNTNCAQIMSAGWWFTDCFYKWCLTCTAGTLGNILWSNESYLNFPFFEAKIKGCGNNISHKTTTNKNESIRNESFIILAPQDTSQKNMIIAIIATLSIVLFIITLTVIIIVYIWLRYKRNMIVKQDYGII